MSWALSVRVGDTTRKMVLIGYANHAHRDGRHAWASKDTIAEYAECSNRTVRRHVEALVAEGWMREGDQNQVIHLRADRRPVVYDLAMNEATRLAWQAEAKAGRPDSLSPRTDQGTAVTTGQPVPPSNPDDLTPVSPRDDATGGHTGGHPRPNGGSPVTPKPSRTKELPPQPPASGGSPLPDPTNQPPPTGCPKHHTGKVPGCRGCGTTPRQVEAARKRAEAAARRQADADELRAARQAKAAAAPSPTTRALLAQTRAQLRQQPRKAARP